MRLFKRKRSTVWQCAYKDRDDAWRHASTHRTDKQAAREVALQLERDALRDPRDTAAAAATVADALKLLSEHCAHQVAVGEMAAATGEFYAVKAGHVLRALGRDTLLSAIDSARVRRYCTDRQKEGAGLHTLAKELTALRVALRLAVERGWWRGQLDTLVPAGIKSKYKPRERWLPLSEVEALMRVLPPGRAAVVAFAVATGAEKAALFRAERSDVVIGKARGRVNVRGSKNENRRRSVPLLLPEARTLARYALKHGDGAGELLFMPWHNCNRDIADACEAAGIEHVSPNDLRRTYAHWHYQAGVTLDVLAPAMGHVDTTMLSRVYAKPSAGELEEKMHGQLERRPPRKATRKKPAGKPTPRKPPRKPTR